MSFIASSLYWAQAQADTASTPDWGMLGVLIGVISLLVASIIGILQIKAAQRPKKDIRCILVTSVPLLKVDDKFQKHLQVTFKGKEIMLYNSLFIQKSVVTGD
ncbi:MAG: hypothetical protein F6K47_34610 [Symploca sp. SIO2E6]|nr:hypothetical protein [Symploca sp. SIO2E6]